MKIYIAGKLCTKSEREFLENIAEICEKQGFETFLPHRDVGLAESIKDVEKIFKGDVEDGFKDIDLIVAVLDGLHIGAGTAWELGYAYAKGIPSLGIKTDEPIKEALEYLSSILIYSTEMITNLNDFKKKLEDFKNDRSNSD